VSFVALLLVDAALGRADGKCGRAFRSLLTLDCEEDDEDAEEDEPDLSQLTMIKWYMPDFAIVS
jgi:hypothetical protein